MTKRKTPPNTAAGGGLGFHLEQELILGDSLHRFDQIGGDRVGQPVPLLDLLHAEDQSGDHMFTSKEQAV